MLKLVSLNFSLVFSIFFPVKLLNRFFYFAKKFVLDNLAVLSILLLTISSPPPLLYPTYGEGKNFFRPFCLLAVNHSAFSFKSFEIGDWRHPCILNHQNYFLHPVWHEYQISGPIFTAFFWFLFWCWCAFFFVTA